MRMLEIGFHFQYGHRNDNIDWKSDQNLCLGTEEYTWNMPLVSVIPEGSTISCPSTNGCTQATFLFPKANTNQEYCSYVLGNRVAMFSDTILIKVTRNMLICEMFIL